MAFVVAYFFAFFFALIFTCHPVAGHWRYFDIAWRFKHKLTCNDEGAILVGVVIVGTLQDFLIWTLPILLIWNLQMPRRQKFALAGLFGIGLM